MFKKMRKLRVTKWRDMTCGEKIAYIVFKLAKWAVIITVGLALASAVFSIAFGIFAAFAMANAIAGGFEAASHAYHPGDQYVHFDRW